MEVYFLIKGDNVVLKSKQKKGKKILLSLLLGLFGGMGMGSVATAEQGALPSVTYQSHVQNIGWMKPVSDGELSGTTGKNFRVEALKIWPKNFEGNLIYQTHVQNIGWMKPVANGKLSGTTGRALQVEALKLSLTGPDAKYWSIEYRTHIQNIGWQEWKKDGELSGTTGKNLQVEALEVQVVARTTPMNLVDPVLKTKNITLKQGDQFDYLTPIVQATDEYGEPISLDQLQVDGQVNVQQIGTYPITYTYKSGVTAKALIKVEENTQKVNEAALQENMLRLVNQYRKEQGQKPLALKEILTQAASIRAKELNQQYAHTRPNGKGFSSVYTDDLHQNFVGELGENAVGIQSYAGLTEEMIAQQMFDKWQKSPSHQKNMLKPSYTHMGFATYLGTYQQTPFLYGIQWFYHN